MTKEERVKAAGEILTTFREQVLECVERMPDDFNLLEVRQIMLDIVADAYAYQDLPVDRKCSYRRFLNEEFNRREVLPNGFGVFWPTPLVGKRVRVKP